MDRINHSETCLILPMDEQDKVILMELVRHMVPHKRELVEKWQQSFLNSAARPATMSDQLVSEMAGEMIDALIELREESTFNQYFEAMRRLGQKYVRLGVPYSSLVFAMHLYEEVTVPIIARVYASVDSLQKVLIAQDHLFHNVLALFAAAYYESSLDELIRVNHELEEEHEKMQEFLSMVVHEFRGPLTVLAGFVQLQEGVAAKGGSCDLHVLETIRSQAKRLDRLVSDLADLSLLDSGRFEMMSAECDLVALARKTVEEQRITTSMHSVVLEARAEAIVGQWDGERVAQAMTNLVSNAIKYSPDGGQVKISLRQTHGEAVISVSDEGVGVAASDIGNLFEPFSRLYRERRIKGTGLGLYITRGIIQAHGGRVWVDSEEGKGSTFHIALPIRPAKGKRTPGRAA